MSKARDLMKRLEEMPSQMPNVNDDDWWNRIIQDRLDAVFEIKRLVKSRNKWAAHYAQAKEKLRLKQIDLDEALDARDEWQGIAEQLNGVVKEWNR